MKGIEKGVASKPHPCIYPHGWVLNKFVGKKRDGRHDERKSMGDGDVDDDGDGSIGYVGGEDG